MEMTRSLRKGLIIQDAHNPKQNGP